MRFIWLIALSTVLLAQTAIYVRGTGPRPPRGPTTGEVIPFAPVAAVGDTMANPVALPSLLAQRQGCSLLTFVQVDCSWCKRMRRTWPERYTSWSREVGAAVSPIWISGDGPQALDSFYAGFNLEGITLVRLTDDPGRYLRLYGVFGTPTTYLVDAEGRLIYGVLGDYFPSIEVAREMCL